jgi:phosphoribosylglycinamide formyltransferase-1
MEALLRANLPAQIGLVISNDPAASGLVTAKAQGIATLAINHRQFETRAAFEVALAQALDQYQADYIVLAGFMRVLTAEFVNRYYGKLINIHPSLLPAFPGLHTHRQALASGVRIHGCSVHFVTPQLDHGPIIAQAAVAVHNNDTEDSLAARVLQQEHQIYPQVLRWLCADRVSINAQGGVDIANASEPHGALQSPAIAQIN